MIYDVEFRFAPEMTIRQVNEKMESIINDLDGCMADEYDINADGLSVVVEFDWSVTLPEAIQRWLKDNEGVSVDEDDLEDW